MKLLAQIKGPPVAIVANRRPRRASSRSEELFDQPDFFIGTALVSSMIGFLDLGQLDLVVAGDHGPDVVEGGLPVVVM